MPVRTIGAELFSSVLYRIAVRFRRLLHREVVRFIERCQGDGTWACRQDRFAMPQAIATAPSSLQTMRWITPNPGLTIAVRVARSRVTRSLRPPALAT